MNLTYFLKQTDAVAEQITYLGERTGHDADRLISEAVGLLNDISLEISYAEKYAAVHPGLFLGILENGGYAADNMVSAGIKAITAIPGKYIVRSRAALKTAEYVIAAKGERSLLEKCCFVGYS